jgi:chromosome segregation ATPase
MDDRMIQRLEQQLTEAHSTNADLRERLGDVAQRERTADARVADANARLQQLEQAHAKQKAAEDNAAAAQRKCDDAEREALRARGELVELRERFDIVRREADALNELNARVEAAKHVNDLFLN